MNECITIREMQQLLKIGQNKAYNLAHTEGFPALHLGRRIVVPVDRLEQWLDTQNSAAAAKK